MFRLSFGEQDFFLLIDEEGENVDSLVQQATWIVTQIENQLFHAFPFQFDDSGLDMFCGVFGELIEKDVSRIGIHHAVPCDRIDMYFLSDQCSFHGACSRSVHDHGDGSAWNSTQLFADVGDRHAVGFLSVNRPDDVTRLQSCLVCGHSLVGFGNNDVVGLVSGIAEVLRNDGSDASVFPGHLKFEFRLFFLWDVVGVGIQGHEHAVD